jgi:hypothetical protein
MSVPLVAAKRTGSTRSRPSAVSSRHLACEPWSEVRGAVGDGVRGARLDQPNAPRSLRPCIPAANRHNTAAGNPDDRRFTSSCPRASGCPIARQAVVRAESSLLTAARLWSARDASTEQACAVVPLPIRYGIGLCARQRACDSVQ